MKSIKQHILERLVLSKSDKHKITYDMLFDALNNMKHSGLRLADIWLPDKRPVLPELEDEKRVAGWQITALYCRINEKGEYVISMNVAQKHPPYNTAFVRLTPENLHIVFSDEDLEKIYESLVEDDSKIEKAVNARIAIKLLEKINLKIEKQHTQNTSNSLDEYQEIMAKIISKKMELLNMTKMFIYERDLILLSLLEDDLRENKTQYLNELINLKYEIIFLSENIESYAVNNNFKINLNEIVITETNEDLYQMMRVKFAEGSAIKEMTNMLAYPKSNMDFDLYSRAYYLKSVLIMLSNTDYKEALQSKETLKGRFEEMKILSLYNSLALDLIKTAFTETETLKNKHCALKLKI